MSRPEVLLILAVKTTGDTEDMTLGTPRTTDTVWAWLHVLRTGVPPQNDVELAEWARVELLAHHGARRIAELEAKTKAKARERFRVITNEEKET